MADKLAISYASKIEGGDELHNINCYEYLKKIFEDVVKKLPILTLTDCASVRYLQNIFEEHSQYDSSFPFGDVYTTFLIKLEKDIENKKNQNGQLKPVLDIVYANPNQALERSAAMIQQDMRERKHTSTEIEQSVRDRMLGPRKRMKDKLFNFLNFFVRFNYVNQTTPQEQGFVLGLLFALLRKNYKPQFTTNIASIRKYQYQTSALPNEYRFSTQGQYVEAPSGRKTPRVSPMFEAWIEGQKDKSNENKITHVYFNNLGRDRKDFEGLLEKGLSDKLEEMEKRHPNIAVITLPADKGLMTHHKEKELERIYPYDAAYSEMFQIATNNLYQGVPVKDFYISKRVKELLYRDENGQDNEEKIVRGLLAESFRTLGFNENSQLSGAEKQAVYFHFIKFELTNYILEKLQPISFNMSCKDAIDRGGVSSAYYNLIKSLKLGKAMDQQEFYRALHAAPTMVKGRGMNNHTVRIWNAIDRYIRGGNEVPKWLVEWRDDHAPKGTRQYYINQLLALENQKSASQGFFFKKKLNTADEKQAIAVLKALLEDRKPDSTPSPGVLAAFSHGKLKVLAAELKSHKVLDAREELLRLSRDVSVAHHL